jgi:hypothetical protein
MKNKNGVMQLSSCAVVLVGAFLSGEPAPTNRPNVLLILTDDMRYGLMTHESHLYIRTPQSRPAGR